jgi:hypothetical protein
MVSSDPNGNPWLKTPSGGVSFSGVELIPSEKLHE